MKIKLVNIGRNKINKIIEGKDIFDGLREAEKHLASRDVELVPHEKDERIFYVFVGGFRNVGQLEVID